MSQDRPLYRVLGVLRNATGDAVKKAYRALAKVHHPDHEGNADKFREVQAAYDVLSDPERRKHYDATGEARGPRPDNAVTELMGVLAPALMTVLQEIGKAGGEIDREDVVAHLKTVLKAAEAEHRKNADLIRKGVAVLEKALERFEVDDGENLLRHAATFHLNAARGQVDNLEAEAARIGKARDYLKKCKYRHIARVMRTAANANASTFGTWG